MEETIMKAGELMKELQRKYPHLNTRLGTAEDPEASLVLVNFFPKSMKLNQDIKDAKKLSVEEHKPGKTQRKRRSKTL